MKKIKIIGFIALALVLLVISAIFLRPSQIISRQEAIEKIAQKDSKYFQWEDCKVHYVDQGQGKIILMIHGLGGSHRNFEKLASEMSKDYRVIRIDLPGFGLSEFPQKRKDLMNIYEDMLVGFVEYIQADSIILVGNSMGGMISWVYTYKHPEKVEKLVLAGSAGYNLEEARKQAIQLARFDFVRAAANKGVPLFLTKSGVKRCYYNPDFIIDKEVEKANIFWNIEGHLDVFFDIAKTKEFPNEAWIKEIKKPCLIIWGENDEIAPLVNASKFERDIEHSKKIIYSHCGHMPQNECTQRMSTDIRQFIEGK